MSLESKELYARLVTDDARSEHTLFDEEDIPPRRLSQRQSSRLAGGIIIGQGLLNFVLLVVLVVTVTRDG